MIRNALFDGIPPQADGNLSPSGEVFASLEHLGRKRDRVARPCAATGASVVHVLPFQLVYL
jgi:hypothetical protein